MIWGDEKGAYKDYEDIKTIDKVCPILSAKLFPYHNQLMKCIGNECMWWGKCNKEESR